MEKSRTRKYSMRAGLILILAWLLITAVMLVATAEPTGSAGSFSWEGSKNNEGTNASHNVENLSSDSTKILYLRISATSSTFKDGNCSDTNAADTTNTVTITNNSENVLLVETIEHEGLDGDPDLKAKDTLTPGESFTVSVTAHKKSDGDTVSQSASGWIKIAYKVLEKIEVVFYGADNASYQYGGTTLDSISSSISEGFSLGTSIKLPSAPTVEKGDFIGWRLSHDGSLHAAEDTVDITEPTSVYPVVINDGLVAPFTVGDSSYYYWTDAAYEAANSTKNKVIVLNDDYTLPTMMAANGVHPLAGSKYVTGTNGNIRYIVPSGVTFLVPYNSDHTVITSDMEDHVSSTSDAKTLYRQLTLSSGAAITVHGAISVGSQASRQMVGQVGPYGAIVLDKGSNITIGDGGFLYAWGYIFPGNDGAGTVTVQNGGTVYEAAMIMDYTGSASSAKNLYDAGVFPLRAYTLRNVEVPATFQYGSKNLGFYCIYSGTFNTNLPGFLTFIGSSSGDKPIFYITDGAATIEKSYASGKQIINLKGNMTLSSISVTLSSYQIASSKTSGLVLPSGYIVSHSDGTLTLGDNAILAEGSKISVAASSTIITNGKNIYILDATDDDPGAVSATDIHGTSYTKVNQDAVLDINGTLNVSGGFYTSPGKASIISSEGTGKIVITKASSDTTLKFKVDKSGTKSITVNPAYLQNKDGTYLQSTVVGTYKYISGYWHLGEDHTYNWDSVLNDTETKYINHLCCDFCTDLLAKVDLQYRLDDYIWMNAVVTLENGVTGEITSDSGIELVDLENGKYYLVRRVLSTELTTDFTANLKINGETWALDLGFEAFIADLHDGHKHKDLVNAMLNYGVAADKYFESQTHADLTISNAPDTFYNGFNEIKIKTDYGPLNSYNNVTMHTTGAAFSFEERISMMVRFNAAGLTEGDISQIGLLVGTGDAELRANGSTGVTAYILYDPDYQKPTEVNPNKPNCSNYTLDWSNLATFEKLDLSQMIVSFDLTTQQYLSRLTVRPYVVTTTGTVIYGEQYVYGLSDYIYRTYNKTGSGYGQDFQNFLYYTWMYATEAQEAFAA